jgi:ABC-2 type transport system ATP-binding protein
MPQNPSAKTAATTTSSKNAPIISIKNLVKQFAPNEPRAVDDVSFDVAPGEIFGFLGPNGAGKTTTIKMLTTLLHPTSGTISINGFDPTRDANGARHSFGIVFQDPSLDDELTAYENMEFHGVLYGVPREKRLERIETLLNVVELWDRRGDLVKHFSGGMKRRLEIARGLLHHPKVLFLDEPTVGLDPQTRNHIWGHIQKLNREAGVTIFFTTHYMEEAEKVSTRIAVIDHGHIIGLGTAATLRTQTGTNSLEEAFLKLTGKQIRADDASSTDQLRNHARMWRGGNKR